MSRRKKPRRVSEGTVRLLIECDGTGKDGPRPHTVARWARVLVKPRPDLPDYNGGYAVEVEYVHAVDDPEDNDYMLPVRRGRYHQTHRFVCRVCGRDRPLKEDTLVKLALRLDTLGQHRIRLREIPDGSARVINE